jgi:hypothetical protein
MRAYRAAWVNNALTMMFMNVTNPASQNPDRKAFAYLTSTLNQSYPLYYPDGEQISLQSQIYPNILRFGSDFGEYLIGTDVDQKNYTTSNGTTIASSAVYSNPYNISAALSFTETNETFHNFTLASKCSIASEPDTHTDLFLEWRCQGLGNYAIANISNLAAKCGLLYGTPIRQDGSASLFFEPGSDWSVPMYTCASAIKASIKTVSFQYNKTSDLSGVTVLDIVDKSYPNETSKPLWGVENSEMYLIDGNPLWGLVTPEAALRLNISTIRKEHLYLPGNADSHSVNGNLDSNQNLPGADFVTDTLAATYQIRRTGETSRLYDYSGRSNLAVYRLWQNYSHTASTSAKILDLVWTDIAAGLVVGTKSLQNTHQPDSTKESKPVRSLPQATTFTRRIKYRYMYGIPAFCALLLTFISALATIYCMASGHTDISTLRTFLQHTSTGRLLTSRSHASPAPNISDTEENTAEQYNRVTLLPNKVWVAGAGQERFMISAQGWRQSVQSDRVELRREDRGYKPIPTSSLS